MKEEFIYCCLLPNCIIQNLGKNIEEYKTIYTLYLSVCQSLALFCSASDLLECLQSLVFGTQSLNKTFCHILENSLAKLNPFWGH